MVAGITVKNIPPACSKQDLWKHFKSRRHGGGTIDYVLYPLVGDESQAFITFRDSKVATSAASQRHTLHKQTLDVALARKQMLTLCIVDVDRWVVENIPDVGAFVKTLEENWGVRAVDASDTGHMTIGGSLVQIQCVLSQLNSLLPPKSPRSPSSVTNCGIMGNRESQVDELPRVTFEKEPACPTSEVGTVVDPYIMNYAKKFFLNDIQTLERKHHVTYEFDQQDEVALVYILPVGDKGGMEQTPQHIWKAKEQFCRLYHSVFKQVKMKTVRCGSNDTTSLQSSTELAVFETRNMFKCLYVIENPPGEITLVGKPKCVALASDWLARKFSVSMPSDSSSTGNLNVLRMVLSLEDEKHVLSVACCDTAKRLTQGRTVSILDDLGNVPSGNSPEGNGKNVTRDTENAGPDRGEDDKADSNMNKSDNIDDDTSFDTFIRYDTGERVTPAGETDNHMTSDDSNEHKGTPYCHVPCYSALFGPSMFGHGSLVDAHTNFGHQPKEQEDAATTREELETKLKVYNTFHEGKTLQIKSKEVNGRLVLDGALRVNWGVQSAIQFQKKDEDPGSCKPETPKHWRKSYKLAISNGLDSQEVEFDKMSPVSISSSLTDLTQDTGHTGTSLRRYQTVAVRGQRKPRRHDKRRLSMINGHIYDVDTSIFIPAHGSVTSVTISSLDTAPDVIRRLLAKFRVENSPEDFCLCKVMSTGETRMLQENDHPLMERVISGPLEDNAKIFIMDKDKVDVVTQEMAQFINLPKAMLEAFLQKYRDEEEAAIREINNKYVRHRYLIQKALDELAEGT